ncbi:MAG: (d)CMP kinase [Ignavibacteriales bacterium]|nr:MAG: (d)CMP kinase [Ignavibacteriales bacterium]
MLKKIIIAIDGPAGSGKSTAAKNIAQKLGFTYLDTGAMYRAITFIALRNGIAENIPAVIDMARRINLKLRFENGVTRVFVDDEEVTEQIRTAEVNGKVSDISRIPEVRAELVKIQKRLGDEGNIVAEGRDVTTVVFPNADLKIFLTASIDIRTKRRLREFQDKNISITFEEVKANLEKRDRIDSGREISPLKKADDAIELDNSALTPEQDYEFLLKKINEVFKK